MPKSHKNKAQEESKAQLKRKAQLKPKAQFKSKRQQRGGTAFQPNWRRLQARLAREKKKKFKAPTVEDVSEESGTTIQPPRKRSPSQLTLETLQPNWARLKAQLDLEKKKKLKAPTVEGDSEKSGTTIQPNRGRSQSQRALKNPKKRQRDQILDSPGAEDNGEPPLEKPKVEQAIQHNRRKVRTKRQQQGGRALQTKGEQPPELQGAPNNPNKKRKIKGKTADKPEVGVTTPTTQKTEAEVIKLRKSLQVLIDGAVWKEIRKRVYPMESAAGIRRARERKAGRLPDLTGLGKIATLESIAPAIKRLQGQWGPMSFNNRVKAIGAAASAELAREGVPELLVVNTEKMESKGYFSEDRWRFCISKELVSGGALSDADAADLCNTALHEARHAEQIFLAARFSARNKPAWAVANELGIPKSIAQKAVAKKFNTTTDPEVVALGKKMHNAYVAKGKENQKISDDSINYLEVMKIARDKAIKSLTALNAKATDATFADATTNRETLKAEIAEVERRYTLYRNIPYEADAHEVGDAAELAFNGWS